MVDQPDELPETGLAAQIDHAIHPWVVMTRLADLNELNPAAKVIYHLLVTFGLPPFDGDVVLAPRSQDPERDRLSRDLLNLRVPGFLLPRKVDIPFECRRPDAKPQPFVEKLYEAMQTMVWGAITFVD
jgi:hypothetical protein